MNKIFKNKLLIISLLVLPLIIKAIGDPETQSMISKINNTSKHCHKRVKNLTELNQEILNSKKPVILAIKSTSCSACDIIDEAYAELENEIGADVLRLEALIEFARDIKKEHDITSVPTTLFFKTGSKNPTHIMRGANKNEIKRHAYRLTGKAMPVNVQSEMSKARAEAEALEEQAEAIESKAEAFENKIYSKRNEPKKEIKKSELGSKRESRKAELKAKREARRAEEKAKRAELKAKRAEENK